MSTMVALVLAIRVFDRSGQAAADRLTALRTAEAILLDAGISTRWLDCSSSTAARPARACAAPLSPAELAIRITPGSGSKAGSPVDWTLGYSLVEPTTGSGTLATVFSDRVSSLAQAARAAAAVLMGRVVAHEIGHLLLGTNEHSSSGLMRARWTVADVARDRMEDWLFTPDDRTRVRDILAGGVDARRMADTSDDRFPGDS